MRRSRYASTSGQPRGRIKDAVSIRKRPPEAEDRAVPGHWEGDLLAGAGNTHDVVTLVERSSRLVMLVVRVRGKDTESVVGTLSEKTNRLLRQYLPKGTDPSAHSQHDLDAIALKLNSRPRKTLAPRTPADTLASTVALIG
jgi:IS30 family transposase